MIDRLAALLLLLSLLPACDPGPAADPAAPGGGSARASSQPAAELPFAWPPVKGEPYPDLELVDQTGARTRLSSFRGKIVLVEPIGMNCPGCNAFVGANRAEIGHFEGIRPQRGLKSIEEYAASHAGGLRLDDPRVVYVHLLLYSLKMKAPTADDARRWAAHFGMDRAKNQVVLAADARFIGPASYKMIPGFHLIDAEGILRSDSSGHHPKENLYTQLLPLLGKLTRELP